jgi:hypothetical protein
MSFENDMHAKPPWQRNLAIATTAHHPGFATSNIPFLGDKFASASPV